MFASLVNPVDERLTAESSISLVPRTSVFVIEHQSDVTEAPVSCVNRDSVFVAFCISVFQVGFFW